MKKIGIFYGSTTGSTARVANMVADELGIDKAYVYNVADCAPSQVGDYDVLLFGSSTWGDGDMQDDMHDFIDGVKALYLGGKKMAFFGCGDDTMSDTFCNAVGEMYKALKDTDAELIGAFDTVGYDYEHSDADIDGKTVGLLIDNVNHEDLTPMRVKAWAEEIRNTI